MAQTAPTAKIGVADSGDPIVVRALRHGRESAQLAELRGVVDYAAAHLAADPDDAAAEVWLDGDRHFEGTWIGELGFIPIAGQGAPLVDEAAVTELAPALGVSMDSAKAYVGKAVELAWRLPQLWSRVQDGAVPPWKALRIADQTRLVNPACATAIDTALWWCAEKLGPVQTERLIAEQTLRYDPDHAAHQTRAAQDDRRFDVLLREPGDPLMGAGGQVHVEGCLDQADALDLEEAVRHGAAQLAAAGCEESLDARRAMAVGEMSRSQLALDFEAGVADSTPDMQTALVPASAAPFGQGRPQRSVVLYAHLTHDATGGFNPLGELANTHTAVVLDVIKGWAGDAAKIVIKPVIDLPTLHDTCEPASSYTPTEAIKEQVQLRDPHCVFPYCHRPAARCDCDHITPHPAGQTCICDLAPLCRRHHRAKTHAGFTYLMVEPGVYRWKTPHSLRYRVDQIGTTDLTPDQTTDPPSRRRRRRTG